MIFQSSGFSDTKIPYFEKSGRMFALSHRFLATVASSRGARRALFAQQAELLPCALPSSTDELACTERGEAAVKHTSERRFSQISQKTHKKRMPAAQMAKGIE